MQISTIALLFYGSYLVIDFEITTCKRLWLLPLIYTNYTFIYRVSIHTIKTQLPVFMYTP